MKKAIIFDAYGTLISTGSGSVDATKAILDMHNLKLDEKEVYKNWKSFRRSNVDEIINSGIFETEKMLFEKELKMIYDLYNINEDYKEDVKIMLNTLGKRKIFDDTADTLNLLKKDYKLYIGSTTDTIPLMQDLENNNIRNIFDGIYTSEGLKTYKPKEDFYTKILNNILCKNNEVIFVGDSLNDDIFGPQRVGIYSVLLDRKDKYDKNNEIKPNEIIKQLSDLPVLMEKINTSH